MNKTTTFPNGFSTVHYRKLKNWAKRNNRLSKAQALEILRGHCVGIDYKLLADLEPCLIRLTQQPQTNEQRFSFYICSRGPYFWIPFASSYCRSIFFAIGFNHEDLLRTILLHGEDNCKEVIILWSAEEDILNHNGILLGKSREKTRINAVDTLTYKLIKKYGK